MEPFGGHLETELAEVEDGDNIKSEGNGVVELVDDEELEGIHASLDYKCNTNYFINQNLFVTFNEYFRTPESMDEGAGEREKEAYGSERERILDGGNVERGEDDVEQDGEDESARHGTLHTLLGPIREQSCRSRPEEVKRRNGSPSSPLFRQKRKRILWS